MESAGHGEEISAATDDMQPRTKTPHRAQLSIPHTWQAPQFSSISLRIQASTRSHTVTAADPTASLTHP